MSIFQQKHAMPFLFVFATGALVFAGGDHGFNPHKKADKIVARMEKELNLSKEQKEKINKLAHEVAEQFTADSGQGPGLHREFVAQLRKPKTDTAALRRELEEKTVRFKERHALLIGKFAELHAILTPEQREKLAKHMEKRREKDPAHSW